MRALLDRIEPSLGSERRTTGWRFCKRTGRWRRPASSLVFALIFLVFALELNFLGRQQFIPILLLRLIFFAFSLVVLVPKRSEESPRTLDQATLAWTTGFAAQFVALTGGVAHRGAELTQQLLAFSRQQVLELKVVSLNELVSDTQRMLMRTM